MFLPPGRSPLAAGATIPLSFVAAGLVAAVLATGWVAFVPGTLALPYLHMHVVALAHAWLLGAMLTITFGAVYQLLPVLANTGFRGATAAWIHLVLHLVGAATMVFSFLAGRMELVAAGGALVGIGVMLFAINVGDTLRRAHCLDPVLVAFGAAAAWLLVTVAAGLSIALNLHYGWWSLDVLALLRAHAHAGVAGFFVTLLQGAMFRLVPMFTLAEVRDLRGAAASIALSQLGLLLLGPGFVWSNVFLIFSGTALLLGSFLVSGIALHRILQTRKKRHFEPGLRGFFLGLFFLSVAAIGGATLAFGVGTLEAALAYGVVAVLGGVLATIEGMLCKIVPFLVWMRVYGPRVGRRPTPVAGSLGRAAAERFWLRLHAVSVVLLAIGIVFSHLAVLAVGAVLFAAGQCALLVSLASSARHLWRPATPGAVAVSPRPKPAL